MPGTRTLYIGLGTVRNDLPEEPSQTVIYSHSIETFATRYGCTAIHVYVSRPWLGHFVHIALQRHVSYVQLRLNEVVADSDGTLITAMQASIKVVLFFYTIYDFYL